MFLAEILDNNFRSVSIIGMGKNTGKTFTLNQLLTEGRQRGINTAITSIGLDGEARDSVFQHDKPQIVLNPGQLVANAKSLVLESRLDYEILATTGIMTPLGEIILVRALSHGTTTLAGPGTGHELARVKEQLEAIGIDVFLVDGAIDRRSLSAPMVTETTVLAVGAELAWDRQLLLERLELQYRLLTLPVFEQEDFTRYLRMAPDDFKAVLLTADGLQQLISQSDFLQNDEVLRQSMNAATEAIYVRGMLTDELVAKILAAAGAAESLTIVALDPTTVFLSKRSFQRLAAHGIALRVLDPIHISAVTVNPFSSSYGYADPIRLLKDVGQMVYPVPCYDLALGIRYFPKEDVDAIS